MKLASLRDTQRAHTYFSLVRKRLEQPLRGLCECKPIFVFGAQRSGTGMVMHAFHRHPDTLVHDEHRENEIYYRHRIRAFPAIRKVLENARFPVACFKPICDSHRINEFAQAFPDAHLIWVYRGYQDVANSSLRKFGAGVSTRAVRRVCTGQSGGGWFQEGVSSRTEAVLRELYHPGLSDFELRCLVWWARNRIIVESGLIESSNVTLLKYEALVSAPRSIWLWLCERLELRYTQRLASHISAHSIGRHHIPAMSSAIRQTCDSLLEEIDVAFYRQTPGQG